MSKSVIVDPAESEHRMHSGRSRLRSPARQAGPCKDCWPAGLPRMANKKGRSGKPESTILNTEVKRGDQNSPTTSPPARVAIAL